MVFILDSFLICDHKNDVWQEENSIKNNSFLDLIFAKNELEEIQKESNPHFSRKNVEGKFICKNVYIIFSKFYLVNVWKLCSEVKETIKANLKENIISSENFSFLINLMKSDEEGQNPYLNVKI